MLFVFDSGQSVKGLSTPVSLSHESGVSRLAFPGVARLGHSASDRRGGGTVRAR